MNAWLAASLERAADAALALEVSQFLILADGMVFVVKCGAVVTVIKDDGRHAHLLAPERDDA